MIRAWISRRLRARKSLLHALTSRAFPARPPAVHARRFGRRLAGVPAARWWSSRCRPPCSAAASPGSWPSKRGGRGRANAARCTPGGVGGRRPGPHVRRLPPARRPSGRHLPGRRGVHRGCRAMGAGVPTPGMARRSSATRPSRCASRQSRCLSPSAWPATSPFRRSDRRLSAAEAELVSERIEHLKDAVWCLRSEVLGQHHRGEMPPSKSSATSTPS